MTTVGLNWSDKLDVLTRGLKWASGVSGVWKFQSEAFQAPSSNDPWFELRMNRVFEVMPDEVCQADNIDPDTGLPDVTNPRKEVVVGQREFRCELRVFGRDQEHDVVAWVIADRTRTRMRLPYFRNEFLNKPANLSPDGTPSANISLVELFDVVPMPRFTGSEFRTQDPPQVVFDRWQSEAMLEMRFSTVIAEEDAASIGTWIEKTEISSNILQPDGVTPIDSSLQLNDRLIDAS